MTTITLDESCIGTVIRDEGPYVKLLSAPKKREEQWTALAQVDEVLAIVELTLKPTPKDPIDHEPKEDA